MRLCALLVSLSFLSGCLIVNAPRYTVENVALAQGETFSVELFDMTHADTGYQGNVDFGAVMAEDLAGALQEVRHAAAVVSPGSRQLPSKYLVRGSVIALEPGSLPARFWIFGTGAGMGHVRAQARLIRVKDGKELSVVEDSVYSSAVVGDELILRRVCATLSRRLALRLIADGKQKN